MKEVTVQELKNLHPMHLIDIRDRYSYQKGTIPFATNIPYILLLTNPEMYLNKNEVYYLFCERGITSERVCESLSEKGYHVVNIIGGYEQYKKM